MGDAELCLTRGIKQDREYLLPANFRCCPLLMLFPCPATPFIKFTDGLFQGFMIELHLFFRSIVPLYLVIWANPNPPKVRNGRILIKPQILESENHKRSKPR